jgi:mono/diheme cytochrome c family protein
VRRLVLILGGFVVLAAGCGSEGTVSPVPQTVEGTVATQPAVQGNAAAGKKVFGSTGCGGCHTFKAAGSTGAIGPDLDKFLQGKSADFVKQSIVDPNAFVEKGYQPGIMPGGYGSQLSAKQIADLVAFLTQ